MCVSFFLFFLELSQVLSVLFRSLWSLRRRSERLFLRIDIHSARRCKYPVFEFDLFPVPTPSFCLAHRTYVVALCIVSYANEFWSISYALIFSAVLHARVLARQYLVFPQAGALPFLIVNGTRCNSILPVPTELLEVVVVFDVSIRSHYLTNHIP